MKYLIGMGNYARGDDGIGPRLVEAVAERGLDRGFEAVELPGSGIQLLTYFEDDTEKLLLIDCAVMGLEPGAHRLFAPEEAKSPHAPRHLSTHQGDLLDLIEFGRAAGCPVPPIRILAIQPASMELGANLSPEIASKFENYLGAALQELGVTT